MLTVTPESCLTIGDTVRFMPRPLVTSQTPSLQSVEFFCACGYFDQILGVEKREFGLKHSWVECHYHARDQLCGNIAPCDQRNKVFALLWRYNPYLGVSLFCLRLYLSQFCVLCVVHLNVFLSVCGRGALLLLLLEGWGGVWAASSFLYRQCLVGFVTVSFFPVSSHTMFHETTSFLVFLHLAASDVACPWVPEPVGWRQTGTRLAVSAADGGCGERTLNRQEKGFVAKGDPKIISLFLLSNEQMIRLPT